MEETLVKFDIQFTTGGETYTARVEQVKQGNKTYYNVEYMTEDYTSGGRIHRLEQRPAAGNSTSGQWHEHIDTRPLRSQRFIQAVGEAISRHSN